MCTLGKEGVDALRQPDFTPDTSQSWKPVINRAGGPDSTSVAAAVAARLGIPAARVIVQLEPSLELSAYQATMVSSPDSWVARIAEAGLRPSRIDMGATPGTIVTDGRDVACDLLAGRTKFTVPATATVRANVRHLVDAQPAWALYGALDRSASTAETPLERAAVAGSRIHGVLLQRKLTPDDELVADLFGVFFDPATVEAREIGSLAELAASFEDEVKLDASVSARVQQQ
jgi:hypothetical protein